MRQLVTSNSPNNGSDSKKGYIRNRSKIDKILTDIEKDNKYFESYKILIIETFLTLLAKKGLDLDAIKKDLVYYELIYDLMEELKVSTEDIPFVLSVTSEMRKNAFPSKF